MFITIEGVDGAGKTTHLPFIKEWMQNYTNHEAEVILTREPGGTALGENLRSILLSTPMTPVTQTLMFCAARNDHLERVIWPAMQRGDVVICDRFIDSTLAYQGVGGGSLDMVRNIQYAAMGDFHADLTLYFDVPLEVSKERRGARGEATDVTEKTLDENFNTMRSIFLQEAADNPYRMKIIDASADIPTVQERIAQTLADAMYEREQQASRDTHYERMR